MPPMVDELSVRLKDILTVAPRVMFVAFGDRFVTMGATVSFTKNVELAV